MRLSSGNMLRRTHPPASIFARGAATCVSIRSELANAPASSYICTARCTLPAIDQRCIVDPTDHPAYVVESNGCVKKHVMTHMYCWASRCLLYESSEHPASTDELLLFLHLETRAAIFLETHAIQSLTNHKAVRRVPCNMGL